MIVIGIAWLCLMGGAVSARPAPQAPIVSPDDVSTPDPEAIQTATPVAADGSQSARQYVVQPGDTLFAVALEIGVDLEDMPCVVAPDFTPEQPLVIGNVLEIPPPGALCHIVQPGETLARIVSRYGLTLEAIQGVGWNQLGNATPDETLPPGRNLRVLLGAPGSPVAATGARDAPAGMTSAEDFLNFMLYQPVNTSPFAVLAVGAPRGLPQREMARSLDPETGAVPANWPYGSGHFTWPLHGWLTQGYRYDHRAIDLAAPVGTLVAAADRGVVLRAGWNNQGYGNFVVVDHNIDYVTLYAHLSEIFVKEGEVVAQGHLLGQVGSTGNSTGPHLHFEIRDFGRLTNPLELLGK
jgi:murein DD-endopeptidase MepM/ murein hydrolase activator NlpD